MVQGVVPLPPELLRFNCIFFNFLEDFNYLVLETEGGKEERERYIHM